MSCPRSKGLLLVALLLVSYISLFISGVVSEDDSNLGVIDEFTDEDLEWVNEYKKEAESIDWGQLYNLTNLEGNSSIAETYHNTSDELALSLITRPLRIALRRLRAYEALEVVGKTPEQLVALRGFKSKTYYVPTKDGYHIHVIRIVNTKIDKRRPRKRPVIFNHGLFESSTMWLINSRGFEASDYTQTCGRGPKFIHGHEDRHHLNGPMLLANAGYDVWLMSMRGTDFSQKHDKYTTSDPRFWSYSLDHFGLVDVPSVVNFVRNRTKVNQVAYVGHSQATFAIFALLSTKPKYAEIIKPVIAVAPVSHFKYMSSVARLLMKGIFLLTSRRENGPFPPRAPLIRKINFKFCNNELLTTLGCQIMNTLIAGSGKYWLKGYFAHLPFYSSLQVLRHFGQMVGRGKFQMYDHGSDGNMKFYKTPQAPEYDLGKVESQSIYLFSAQDDLLSTVKDVEYIATHLKYPPAENIVIGGPYNHFDLVTSENSRILVFKPILDILEKYHKSHKC